MKALGPLGTELEGKYTVVKILSSRAKALPKNLIRPLSVQDPKGEELQRPTLPFADARRARDGEDYGSGAATRRDENLSFDRAMSHKYRKVKSTSRCDWDLNRLDLGFRPSYLADLETKSPKIKTAKGSRAPARRRA
jgi:hypothetical protein